MHGWLVIHNHFFANTVNISLKSNMSETGVLQEFPISWKGVPEMVLSDSRVGGFTYVRDWAAAVSLLSSLSPFWSYRLWALFVQVKRVGLLEDCSCCLKDPCLSWGCLAPSCTANPLYVRKAWMRAMAIVNRLAFGFCWYHTWNQNWALELTPCHCHLNLHFCFILLEVQDLLIQQVPKAGPSWKSELHIGEWLEKLPLFLQGVGEKEDIVL